MSLDVSVITGDQATLRMSRHIVPDAEDAFEWYTFRDELHINGLEGIRISGMMMSCSREVRR